MLSPLEFAEAVDLLTKCLPTPKIDERISGLYYFFKKESYETVRAAAEVCAKKEERFPTPGVFGGYINACRVASKTAVISCEFCGGVGIVHAKHKIRLHNCNYAFRCHCANAAKYPNIPAWSKDSRADYDLMQTNPYQDIYENPELYEKGLKHLSDTLTQNGITINNTIKQDMLRRIEAGKKRKQLESAPF